MITNTEHTEETSVFLSESFESIDSQFTELQELSTHGFARLLKAKRYGRWYVLKTLNDEASEVPAYREALRKELEVLMQMQHPSVVQATGFEHVEGVGPCIIMEYIDGETLQQALEGKQEQLSLQDRQRMAEELISAIGYIHSLGIVHRDLKPQNIMVTRNGHRVKLIDFGMADTDQHAVLKQPAGTLRYMAPEQAQQAVPDIRNDIYSLGLILHELHLDSVYDKVVERCLKPIDLRYRNIAELTTDIRRKRESRRLWKRNAVAAVVMLLMTAVAMTVWQRLTQAADSASQQATVIDSLQHRLAQQQAENQQARANLQQQMATNITAQNQSISQLTMVNEQLQNELNRTRQAKIAALEALHKEIRRSHIDSHIDTLSRWKYRWQDLSLRMTNISRFIYRYVDGLTTLTPPERDQIRMSMLDVWQQWNTNVMNRVHSIRRRVLSNNPDTLLIQPNKIPKEAL